MKASFFERNQSLTIKDVFIAMPWQWYLYLFERIIWLCFNDSSIKYMIVLAENLLLHNAIKWYQDEDYIMKNLPMTITPIPTETPM